MENLLKDQQPRIYNLFQKLIETNKLQHAYLFEGALGTGKREGARWVAKRLFCSNLTEEKEPCETCRHCQRINQKDHPDVIEIEPKGEVVKSIKVEEIRYLKTELNLSGVESKQKVIIVDQADKMTTSSSNSLLKFLEEPSGDVHIFLLTRSKQNILPTIVSRSQLISFQSQSFDLRVKQLQALDLPSHQASLMARITQSNEMALEYSQDEEKVYLVDLAWRWFKLLVKKDAMSFVFVESQIKKVISDKASQEFLLDLLMIAYQDLLHLYYQKDSHDIAFINRQKELGEIAQSISLLQMAQSLENILHAKKLLKANVSSSSAFEYLAIELCR